MARRPLLLTVAVSIHVGGLSTSSYLSISLLYCLAAVAAVVAAVTFLCGSSSTSSSPSLPGGEEKVLWRLSAKAHLLAKKMTWKRTAASPYSEVSGGRGEGDDDEVWRKAIIMGDRCRQLDFSGRISYDCEGNLVQPPPPLLPSSSSSPSRNGSTKHINS